VKSEGKLLITKFEFGGSFGKSLQGDCHEIEVTLNLEFLVTFGTSSGIVCHMLIRDISHDNLMTIFIKIQKMKHAKSCKM
jgi:hypothetical protein